MQNMFLPEGVSSNEESPIAPSKHEDKELSSEEFEALEKRFVIKNKSRMAIGAMAMSAVLSGVIPDESHAQAPVSSEKQTQPEPAEQSVVRSGDVVHPEFGALTIQVYYNRKKIDMNNLKFDGKSMYGVLLNGVEMTVSEARFLKNGVGYVEFKNSRGDLEVLQFPSVQDAMNGEKPKYLTKSGEVLIIRRK